MIRPTFREALVARTLTLLRVIWGALVAAVLIDVVVGVWLVLRMGRMFPSDVAATLTPALYAVAVAVALLTLWWRRLLTADRCVADATAAAASPALKVAAESDTERRAVGALARFQNHNVIVWALCEAIAIIGFVLSIGAGDTRYVIGLAAASLVLLAMHVPTQRRVEAIVAAVPSR